MSKRFSASGLIVFLGAFAALARPGHAVSTTSLMGIDLYGTDRYTETDLQEQFGDRIRLWARKRALQARNAAKNAEDYRRDLEEDIRVLWDLHWARFSWNDYYATSEPRVYITLDVIESKDRAVRMPFRPPPRKTFPDPSGLLADWGAYSEMGWSLVRTGRLNTDRPACRGFYCLWGSQTQELKALEDRFVEQAPAHKDTLVRILDEDKDPSHRANAAYLLAYCKNGSELSHMLQNSLTDADSEVRSAAMQVYADLGVYHKDVPLPIERIAVMLDYPTVEDRSKALAVMVAVADHPAYRSFLVRSVAESTIKLLRLRQPANHDMAYAFLSLLSKETYGSTDFAAWRAWLGKAKALEAER